MMPRSRSRISWEILSDRRIAWLIFFCRPLLGSQIAYHYMGVPDAPLHQDVENMNDRPTKTDRVTDRPTDPGAVHDDMASRCPDTHCDVCGKDGTPVVWHLARRWCRTCYVDMDTKGMPDCPSNCPR